MRVARPHLIFLSITIAFPKHGIAWQIVYNGQKDAMRYTSTKRKVKTALFANPFDSYLSTLNVAEEPYNPNPYDQYQQSFPLIADGSITQDGLNANQEETMMDFRSQMEEPMNTIDYGNNLQADVSTDEPSFNPGFDGNEMPISDTFPAMSDGSEQLSTSVEQTPVEVPTLDMSTESYQYDQSNNENMLNSFPSENPPLDDYTNVPEYDSYIGGNEIPIVDNMPISDNIEQSSTLMEQAPDDVPAVDVSTDSFQYDQTINENMPDSLPTESLPVDDFANTPQYDSVMNGNEEPLTTTTSATMNNQLEQLPDTMEQPPADFSLTDGSTNSFEFDPVSGGNLVDSLPTEVAAAEPNPSFGDSVDEVSSTMEQSSGDVYDSLTSKLSEFSYDSVPDEETTNTVTSSVPQADMMTNSDMISNSVDTSSEVNNVVAAMEQTSVDVPAVDSPTNTFEFDTLSGGNVADSLPTDVSGAEATSGFDDKLDQLSATIEQSAGDISDTLKSKLSELSYDEETANTVANSIPQADIMTNTDMVTTTSGEGTSEVTNRILTIAMDQLHKIVEQASESAALSSQEVQKALQENAERIIQTSLAAAQGAAQSAGESLQAETTKALMQGSQSIQEGTIAAVNYIGGKSLVDLGKVVYACIQLIGRLIFYILDALLNDLSDTNMADVVGFAQSSTDAVITDVLNSVTTTVNNIGEMTLAEAAQNLVIAVITVAKFAFSVLNYVINFLSGQDVTEWSLAAKDVIEYNTNLLVADASAALNDFTHMTISELSGSIVHFSQEVGNVVVASAGQLSDVVGTQIPIDTANFAGSALDSVTAAMQMTQF